MHFDDRLATVLRRPATSETIARAHFRQLLDLLGTLPNGAHSERIDAAYLRLSELSAAIPAAERAAILEEPGLRLRAPRLVAQLALAEPPVALAAMARAELDVEQWLDLIPALPVRARGVVRHRRGLGRRVEALLARLGVADRGLPPAEISLEQAPDATTGPEPAPAEAAAGRAGEVVTEPEQRAQPEPAQAPPLPHIDEIGAIVRRIEAFRKSRAAAEQEGHGDAPRLPLGESEVDAAACQPTAFDFASDADGRVVWAEPAIAPAVIGLRLAARDPDGPVQGSPELIAAFRHRQPITGAAVAILGAPAVSGEWRIDAAPRFDRPGGRFVGYVGRLRRPMAADAALARDSEADRMRQILHELRTPVNAIQGFAEVIQQQLFGPTPHEYRALAANVASDSARMLAGFEELDRLVKLDSGAMTLEPGLCDLLPIIETTIAQLDSFNAPRRSGVELDCDVAALPVAIDRAEAERLIWRLLATLAGATAPNEALRLRARYREIDGRGAVRLVLRLPASLAWVDDDALFSTGAGAQPQALGAGMFGTGFALRLAAVEAHAAGGSFERRGEKLRLTLPGAGDARTDEEKLPGDTDDAERTGAAEDLKAMPAGPS